MESTTATKPKCRWLSVLALSAAAFVDSSENYALSVLWPRMYPALGLRVGQLGPVLGISDLIRTISLPLWGWAADRFSRKALLVSITGFWGSWTLVIAFVQSLTQRSALMESREPVLSKVEGKGRGEVKQCDAVFHPEFIEDLQYWVQTDRKMALRALRIVEAIPQDPFKGIGKPEPRR
jgi:hypothetical protein